MSLILRAAIVARLNDAASIFDSLIARASSCEVADTDEVREETNATELAGIAIWEAVERGLFNVPPVARLAGRQRAAGNPQPTKGGDSAQLFLDVMAEFCCSVCDNLFPYYEQAEAAIQAHRKSKKHSHPLCIQQRQHELREYATSCRILATLIDGGDDSAYRPEGEKARVLSAIAKEAKSYSEYICKHARTDGDNEYELFQLIYELRCYYGGDMPDALKPAWEQFQAGTTPYHESMSVAVSALVKIQQWAENESPVATIPAAPTPPNELWQQHPFGISVNQERRLVRRDGINKELSLSATPICWHILSVVLSSAPGQAPLTNMLHGYPGEENDRARASATQDLNKRLRPLKIKVSNRALETLD